MLYAHIMLVYIITTILPSISTLGPLIPSSWYIVPGSNDSLVNLHQIKVLFSNIASSHSGFLYEGMLATCGPKQLNNVDSVWVCVIDVQSWKVIPECC